MLTRQLFFGMNVLSLAGFVLMGLGLTLSRQRQIRAPLAFVMMGAGTALVFAGIHFAPPTLP